MYSVSATIFDSDFRMERLSNGVAAHSIFVALEQAIDKHKKAWPRSKFCDWQSTDLSDDFKFGTVVGGELEVGGFDVDIVLGPQVFVHYFPREANGAVGRLSVEIEADEVLKNNPDQLASYIDFLAWLTPKTGFCWADHEMVLEQVEDLVSFDSIKALCWLNIYGAHLWNRIDATIRGKITTSDFIAYQEMKAEGQFDEIFAMKKKGEADKGTGRHVVLIKDLQRTNPYISPTEGGGEVALAQTFAETSIRGYRLPKLPDLLKEVK